MGESTLGGPTIEFSLYQMIDRIVVIMYGQETHPQLK
jgi:hypothetical protein